MSSGGSLEDRQKKLELAIKGIKKEHGEGAVGKYSDMPKIDVEVVSSGSLTLDHALGVGGLPRGRIVEVYGPECVDADTFVRYEVRRPDGTRQNHKGGTIERLYHRFHGIPMGGRGSYQRPQTVGSVFYAPSINEEGRVFQNRIVDVVRSGEKECYELQLRGGTSIIATAEHRFFTGTRYVSLGYLSAGDTVYIHNNTPYRGRSDYETRPSVMVKNHPVAPIKRVYDEVVDRVYTYHRTSRSRIAMEAHLNGMAFGDYVALLNSGGGLDGLRFLEPHEHVHHKDEDWTNDAPSNLEIVTPEEHGRLHAAERQDKLRFVAVPDEVVSIVPVGPRETYDLCMAAPAHNYVANGMVVHNSSGKTTLTLHALAECQKEGGLAAFIDAEHALDPIYAENLGVDMDNLVLSQPDNGEQALNIVEDLCSSGALDIIVVDSVAALVPKAEIDGEMGDMQVGLQARLMSKACRKLSGIVSKTKTILVFINQTRSKIGVMFGSSDTTSGGNALKFYASQRIDIRRIGTVKKGEDSTASRTKCKVVKNKVAPPFKVCEFDISFGKGINKTGEIVDAAVALALIEKSGAWFKYEGETIAQGRDALVEYLNEQNTELRDQLEHTVRKNFGLIKEG